MGDLCEKRDLVRPLRDVRRTDVSLVGGKNASLGEMIANLEGQGIRVPPGFATTTITYWYFIAYNCIGDRISSLLSEWQSGKLTLSEAGYAIRRLFLRSDWPTDAEEAIRTSYRELRKDAGVEKVSVAVRSSATAEDLPNASFAGQQETYLNIRGEEEVLRACTRCYASLFGDRAISYRQTRGFDEVALSIGVQRMVRSDLAGAGVMFSIDTESGFDRIVLINASWGLGEIVVKGEVTPDEYQVYKGLLDDRSLTPIVEKKLGEKGEEASV